MKKILEGVLHPGEKVKKLLIMTKFCFLFVVLSIQLQASVYSQQDRISLKFNNISAKKLFIEIEKLSDYAFVYKRTDISHLKDLNVDFKNTEVSKILDHCLKGTDLGYTFINNHIVIVKTDKKNDDKKKEIKGKVVDEKGIPLPGVTIIVKGTQVGTSSNANGEFTISGNIGETLIVSFIGMQTQEVKIEDLQELKIVLKKEIKELGEIVCTGIFNRKKESFTGSTSVFSEKELKITGNQNIIQSLRTLDPTLLVIENKEYGSDPNRLPDLEIRGKTSIVGLKEEYGINPNQPLFILDGFETTLQTIMDLSLDRVASVTILKDAASTAIYGSKAANGVIVVETKKPEKGKLRVNYSGNFSLEFPDLSDYNLMNSAEKLEFERLSGYYNTDDHLTELGLEEKYYQRLAEVRRGVDTYWLSEPLRTVFNHRHNLYVEGGDNAMRYGLGVNMGKKNGVMKGSEKNISSVNIDLSYRINNFRFSNKSTVDYSNSEREPTAFSEFSKMNPYYRKYDDNGEILKVLDNRIGELVYNPLYYSQLNYLNNNKSTVLNNNFKVEWDIVRGLRARGRLGVNYEISELKNYKSPKHPDFANIDKIERGSYSEVNDKSFKYNGDVSIIFGRLFAEKHQINIVGGWNFSNTDFEKSGYSVIGFINDDYINPAFSAGYKQGDSPTYKETQYRATSFFINSNYSFNNLYLFDINYRSDGSSVFGVNNKFTETWSVGLAWNMHNENFIKNISWISMLKIRASIGNPGNQNFDAYQAMKTYSYNTWMQNIFGLSAVINSYGNRDLKWQKTIDKNIGFDLVMLKNRLRVNFDYYYKDTDPLLVFIGTPSSIGTNQITTNLGGQINKGYSGSLYFSPVYRSEDKINWIINLSFRTDESEYKNMGAALEKLNKNNRENKNLQRYYDGGSADDMWAVKSLGIDPATGKELFLKKDGTSTFEWDAEDEARVGNSRPDLTGIIGSSLYYKGFSASVNFRYSIGGQMFATALYQKVENISENNLFDNQDKRALYDRWKKPGDKSKYKGISVTEATPMSSRFVIDNNILSCESVSLGYESQSKYLEKFGLSSLSVRAYMNDIFRIASIKEERGIQYPFSRSVSLSLNIRF